MGAIARINSVFDGILNESLISSSNYGKFEVGDMLKLERLKRKMKMSVSRNEKLQMTGQEVREFSEDNWFFRTMGNTSAKFRFGRNKNFDESEVKDILSDMSEDDILNVRKQIATGEDEKIPRPLKRIISFVSKRYFKGKLGLALLNSCSIGLIDEVQRLMDAGADANAKNRLDGTTCLHAAAFAGNAEIVKILIESGAEINALTKHYKVTPLLMAAQRGHLDVVKALVFADADVNAADFDGITPLYLASENGFNEIVDILISYDAKVDLGEKSEGATPLHVAVQNGHLNVVKCLIDAFKKTETSIDIGAGEDNVTPLHVASQEGHIEIVNDLIDAGADVNIQERFQGFAPLHLASRMGHKNVMDALIDAGADENLKEKFGGQTPAQLVMQRGQSDSD